MTRLKAGRPPKLSADECAAIDSAYKSFRNITYRHLADTYGVSVSTIKRALARARKGK